MAHLSSVSLTASKASILCEGRGLGLLITCHLRLLILALKEFGVDQEFIGGTTVF